MWVFPNGKSENWLLESIRSHYSRCMLANKQRCYLADFNPDAAIDIWYNKKICCLTTTPNNYPKNRKWQNKPEKLLDVATITISDLEDSEEEEIQWD